MSLRVNRAGPILVAGNLVLDLFPALGNRAASYGDLFKAGALIDVGSMSFAPGGCVANTGIALHKLGVPVRFAAKVGNDALGKVLRGLIGDLDARLGAMPTVDKKSSTSYSVVLSPPKLDRIFLHHCGANDEFRATDVQPRHLQGASLIHVGYPPLMKRLYENDGAELVTIFKRARAKGLVTSLDMAMPDAKSAAGRIHWRRFFSNVLPLTDFFLPSVDEMAVMLHLGRKKIRWEQIREIADRSLAWGAKLVMLKMGDQGAYLRTSDDESLRRDWREREIHSPCFNVKVAGTTGSGDCTIAGLLAAWHRGELIEDALTHALAVGAHSVERQDATSGIAPGEEIARRIGAGWRKRRASAPGAGWTRNGSKLWFGPQDRK
ncbi:MAG: carbohydrate kinase family protein [Candidatus Sumerlaeota bacterium]